MAKTHIHFNSAAEKIVSLKEVKARADALYKDNLTVGEKAYLYLVDRPLTVLSGIRQCYRLVTDPAYRAQLTEANSDGTSGVYKGTDGTYVTVASLQVIADNEGLHAPMSYQQKMDKIAAQAVDEANDYRGHANIRLIRPVNMG